jgi:hypothetical protein
VDDFGVQYFGQEHAEHLAGVIASKYKMTFDWTGRVYCGITLDWDYTNRTVALSMPGSVAKALQCFEIPLPSHPQHAPSHFAEPIYGRQVQLAPEPNQSEPLNPKEIPRLQEIIGVLLYYGHTINNAMLVALGSLAAVQSQRTKATAKAVVHLLNYTATHPDASIQFQASEMCLHIHSNASYLSKSNARSRAGGIFFLSSKPTTATNAPIPPLNGPIHIVSTILRNIMASATEAEAGACFLNAQEATSILTTLGKLSWPQPTTPIQVGNSCATGGINDTVKQRHSKAIDMRFYWVRSRVNQGQFCSHWRRLFHKTFCPQTSPKYAPNLPPQANNNLPYASCHGSQTLPCPSS